MTELGACMWVHAMWPCTQPRLQLIWCCSSHMLSVLCFEGHAGLPGHVQQHADAEGAAGMLDLGSASPSGIHPGPRPASALALLPAPGSPPAHLQIRRRAEQHAVCLGLAKDWAWLAQAAAGGNTRAPHHRLYPGQPMVLLRRPCSSCCVRSCPHPPGLLAFHLACSHSCAHPGNKPSR